MALRILGTGSALPERIVTNDDLAKVVDTSDEWIKSRTGIEKRHLSTGETTTQLSVKASKLAIEMAGIEAETIDLIIVGTVSPDTYFPSTACRVQAEIGAVNAVAFDVNAACSGFMFGMEIAASYFAKGSAKRALIIGAEVLSRVMDWNDRGTCVLFGDGAGAAVVESREDGLWELVQGSDGGRGEALICKNRPIQNPYYREEDEVDYIHMDGQAVFKFAVRTVPASIKEVMERAKLEDGDIKYYLLHQANIRIIESVAKRLTGGDDLERFPTTLQDCGNISAGSVPILLDYVNRKGMLREGDKIVLAGFGAGLTWAAAVMEF